MQGTHKSQIQIDVSVWILLLQQETGTLDNRLLLRAACLGAGAWQAESASVCPLGSQGPCQPCTLLQSCSWTHRFVSILLQLGLELTTQPTRTVQRRDEAGSPVALAVAHHLVDLWSPEARRCPGGLWFRSAVGAEARDCWQFYPLIGLWGTRWLHHK